MNKESSKLLRTIGEVEIEISNKNIKKDKENKFSCMRDKKGTVIELRDRNREEKWKEWKSEQGRVKPSTACSKGREVKGRKKREKKMEKRKSMRLDRGREEKGLEIEIGVDGK